MTKQRPETEAREFSLKFLYQCESAKIFYFSESHFNSFVNYFELKNKVKDRAKELCKGVFENIEDIDTRISELSKKWALDRMPATDRITLRLGAFELLEGETPAKVVLNEAVEIAKTYGCENSGKFVNGILNNFLVEIKNSKDKGKSSL